MTQKDIGTIKRRLRAQKRAPSMLRGCYLDSQGNILTDFKKNIIEVSTEELEKYFAMFRKCLSGTFGQQLLPVNFSDEQIQQDTAYASLMQLCRSELDDDRASAELWESIANWVRKEKIVPAQSVNEQRNAANYLCLLLYDSFDVGYTHPDGEEDIEMSETVFNYMLCSVSPVQRGKDTLSYAEGEGMFHVLPATWDAGMPEVGFMFPSFAQGGANISEAMLYTRDTNNVHEAFLEEVFHAGVMMNATEQKETVCNLIQTTLQEECSMDVVQAVNEKVSEMIIEQKEDKASEPLQLSGKDVCRVLQSAGVSPEKVEAFSESYTQTFGEKAEIPAVNVVSHKEFKVVTPSVRIHVDPEHSDLITTRVIEGQKYIMILADGQVEVNGINIAIQ